MSGKAILESFNDIIESLFNQPKVFLTNVPSTSQLSIFLSTSKELQQSFKTSPVLSSSNSIPNSHNLLILTQFLAFVLAPKQEILNNNESSSSNPGLSIPETAITLSTNSLVNGGKLYVVLINSLCITGILLISQSKTAPKFTISVANSLKPPSCVIGG